MTRAEIRAYFRAECPDVTTNVASDTVLNNWLLSADKEASALMRCIVGDVVITSVASTSVYDTKYDLESEVNKFYDIDDMPGGGVSFDDDPLDKTTVSELDRDSSSWRTRTAGKPQEWYRRGKYLYFDRPVSSTYADKEIRVYTVLISDDFNDDDIMPFNQLAHLEPFHSGLIHYLKWKGKDKIAKPQESQKARQDFLDYYNWAKKVIGGNKFGPIYLQPKTGQVRIR